MPTCHRSLRRCLDLALVALGFCACSDATGSLQGGQQQPLPTVPESSGASAGGSGASSGGSGASSGAAPPAATWTNVYNLYFGNSATGGCGSLKNICHQTKADSGATLAPASGFVCGTSAAECYQGIMNATPPLVTASDATNPAMARVYVSLYQAGTQPTATSDNMPQTLGYAFTASDMALIAQWIKDGASNN